MLSAEERERLQDCMLLMMSAQETLEGLNRGIIPNFEEIEQCLESAGHALRLALRTI
jgi:hypothetical protein